MNTLIIIILVILLITNLHSFIVMGVDKRRAARKQWRISEKYLFLSAACFGALGGTAGMFAFHHKTKHWYFRLFFPLMLIVQAALLVWLYIRFR